MITNEQLRKRYRLVLISGTTVILSFLLLVMFYRPDYYKASEKSLNRTEQSLITANTTRVYGKDIYETAAAISQITYPATFDENKPNAVILVRGDKKEDGIQAARLIHHPNNAPILYIDKNSLPETTWKEMERLDPKGIFIDRNVKVILVGDVEESIKDKIREKGWRFRHIEGKDPFDLGKNISDYLAAFHGDHRDDVMIAPVEKPELGLPQTSWNAHMGDGFFFVTQDGVPPETARALKDRYRDAYIYLMGSDTDIPPEVEEELAKYGHIQRIPGSDDLYKLSVGFAGYKDMGKNFSWWIGKSPRSFGWGIAEAGHNFIFVNPKDWQAAVAAAVLSHKGKHGPQLLVSKDTIPQPVVKYLETVKPSQSAPQEQLFNHGWIIGSTDSISKETQVEIDRLLGYGKG